MTDNSILEPVKLYKGEFKDKMKENTEKYFDDLVKKANTNVEENRDYVKKYKLKQAELTVLNKKNGKSKGWKTFLIVMIVILIAAAIICAVFDLPKVVRIAVPICAVVLVVLFIVLAHKLKNKIKSLTEIIEKLNKEANEILNKCYETMSTLNQSYDWSIPADLTEMTTPLIDLDHTFDVNKFEYLHEKFGFKDSEDPNQSTNYVLSGNINGNPFVLINSYNTEMRPKMYTGSITIHWTTTERDSKGGTRVVSHSQVLTATIEKPAPVYFYDTRLVFGNEGAPNLEFSRQPTVKQSLTDKELDKMVRKGESDLQKKTEKAVKEGNSFNAMANTKFEILFNALNRTNELEYRLLFTPLAQNSMIDILRNGEYGDDFAYYKDHELNYIISAHSQHTDYRVDPQVFVDYDIDNARAKFIDINTNFFKGLYFDLAPLLSIPLYQQTKTHEYIYKIPYEAYNTRYEQETLANRLDKKVLMPDGSRTDAILKCSFNSKDTDTDYITITAHAYKTVSRVETVMKMGGDGHTHAIPVYWDEYIPISKDTPMAMSKVDTTRSRFNNSNELINKLASQKSLAYERGLLSYIVTDEISSMKDIKDKLTKQEKEI